MLRQIKRLLPVMLCISLLMTSCDDIFEEDISNESITLISPINGAEIENNFAMLQWRNVFAVENYVLEVKSAVTGFVIDTLTTATNVMQPLDPGEYFWRVRGENSVYSTGFSSQRSFTIIDVNDLTDQVVFLNTPAEGLFVQSTELVLDWEEVNAASNYEVVVDRTVGADTERVVNETDVLSPPFLLNETSVMADGTYKWSIRAVNDESETEFTSRFFFVDNEIPLIPELISPSDGEFFNLMNPILLEWDIPEDQGEIQSQISSVYELASDENFEDLITTEIFTDGISSAELQQTLTEGDYYWRVRLVDEAGNEGDWSVVRFFTIG